MKLSKTSKAALAFLVGVGIPVIGIVLIVKLF